MRHITDTVRRHRLPPPGLEELARDCLRLREIYEQAYDWSPPEPPPPERTATRTMRQYIKAWITQWDLQRLIGANVGIVEQIARQQLPGGRAVRRGAAAAAGRRDGVIASACTGVLAL